MAFLWLTILLSTLALFLLGIGGCYFWVKWSSAPYLFDKIKEVPYHKTALVLGTAQFTSKGGTNLFYKHRIEAARLVFLHQKAERFIVSGANKKSEPGKEADDMKASLIAGGLPSHIIIVDNKGYRTWDSLWRCKNVFQKDSVLVISQRFHNERAVFIGRRLGMELVGFNAFDVGGRLGFRMWARECLARVKCILDCFLLQPDPVFLRKNRHFHTRPK